MCEGSSESIQRLAARDVSFRGIFDGDVVELLGGWYLEDFGCYVFPLGRTPFIVGDESRLSRAVVSKSSPPPANGRLSEGLSGSRLSGFSGGKSQRKINDIQRAIGYHLTALRSLASLLAAFLDGGGGGMPCSSLILACLSASRLASSSSACRSLAALPLFSRSSLCQVVSPGLVGALIPSAAKRSAMRCSACCLMYAARSSGVLYCEYVPPEAGVAAGFEAGASMGEGAAGLSYREGGSDRGVSLVLWLRSSVVSRNPGRLTAEF
jgi:hypothetical protein